MPSILGCLNFEVRGYLHVVAILLEKLPNTSAFPAFNSSDHVALAVKSNRFVENPGKFDSSSSWCKFVRL